MNRRKIPGLAILGIAFISQLCAAQEITVAAAADLQSAMQDVAARFEQETGKKVKAIFGSSGNFFQQIQNGAHHTGGRRLSSYFLPGVRLP